MNKYYSFPEAECRDCRYQFSLDNYDDSSVCPACGGDYDFIDYDAGDFPEDGSEGARDVNENDLPDVECEDCGWQGDVFDLDDGRCPSCGSKDGIVDYEVNQ